MSRQKTTSNPGAQHQVDGTCTRSDSRGNSLQVWLGQSQKCVGELSTHMTDNPFIASFANYSLQLACGNDSDICPHYCSYCKERFNALTMECLEQLLALCVHNFDTGMMQNNTDWCIWDNVSGLYSNLSLCTEEISDCLLIPWPNLLMEQLFLEIHAYFFKDCPSEELSDPPPVIVFALVITPICLIPVMVSLVVLKTKNGDGST